MHVTYSAESGRDREALWECLAQEVMTHDSTGTSRSKSNVLITIIGHCALHSDYYWDQSFLAGSGLVNLDLCVLLDFLLFYCQEFQMKMESLQQRREELDRKEYQLKESLLKFDKFLKVQSCERRSYALSLFWICRCFSYRHMNIFLPFCYKQHYIIKIITTLPTRLIFFAGSGHLKFELKATELQNVVDHSCFVDHTISKDELAMIKFQLSFASVQA